MLVLSRYKDENIIIGKDIVIKVIDIQSDRVKLGINAPVEIPVHRQEVYEAIQKENRAMGNIQETKETNKPGKLEKNVDSTQADFSQQFNKYLKLNNYSLAYDFLLNNDYHPTRDETSKLKYGLKKSGKLTESAENILKSYHK